VLVQVTVNAPLIRVKLLQQPVHWNLDLYLCQCECSLNNVEMSWECTARRHWSSRHITLYTFTEMSSWSWTCVILLTL